MVIIEATLGNLNQAVWKARAEKANVDRLQLSQWDAQKNRFRKVSEQGMELAVSLDRGAFLRDGDVLCWDEQAGTMVVARIALRDVMVIHLEALASKDPVQMVQTCVELGHALGNQHWPAVVKNNRVYVPLTVDKKVMGSVMNTHAFQDVTYEFTPAEDVIPYLFPHESRRLFGGSEQPSHAHPLAGQDPHGHSHDGHEHGHDHSHGHADHDHDHRH